MDRIVRPHRPDARAAWRRAIGHVLRRRREQVELRLTDVAERAGVSPQYLSEVERGRKEASSEILAAVTAALGLTLLDLAHGVAGDLASSRTVTLTSVPAGGSAVGSGLRSGPAGGVSGTAGSTADVVLLAA
jgi:DNA-binding XRE family transcriptional regulator